MNEEEEMKHGFRREWPCFLTVCFKMPEGTLYLLAQEDELALSARSETYLGTLK